MYLLSYHSGYKFTRHECMFNVYEIQSIASILQECLVSTTVHKAQVMREGREWDKVSRSSSEKAVTNMKSYNMAEESVVPYMFLQQQVIRCHAVSVTIDMQIALHAFPSAPSLLCFCSSNLHRAVLCLWDILHHAANGLTAF